MTEKYVPPLGKGQRVRATPANELIGVGATGTITWTHPWPEMPYRVKWDGHENGSIGFGMDDIGWLTKPEELEAIE